jgi:hypothetical protein
MMYPRELPECGAVTRNLTGAYPSHIPDGTMGFVIVVNLMLLVYLHRLRRRSTQRHHWRSAAYWPQTPADIPNRCWCGVTLSGH